MSAIVKYTVDSLGYVPNVGERFYQYPHGNLKCLSVERDGKSGRVFVTAIAEPNTKGKR